MTEERWTGNCKKSEIEYRKQCHILKNQCPIFKTESDKIKFKYLI